MFVRLGTGTGGSGEPIFSNTETSYDVGSEPRSVTIDDIDGDGNLDLLVANSASDNVSLLRGQGNGTFQTATVYSAGDGVRPVATGLINADSGLDFVTADEVDNTNDVVIENAGEGIDTVNASVTYTLGNNVENLTLTGSANINGTGNSLSNDIRGNDGDNTLDGMDGQDYLYGNGGNDSLLGGGGDDYLFGGTGIDTMRGGTGNDVYEIDNANDVVIENAGEGIDEVQSYFTYTLGNNVERLTLIGGGNMDGTGNDLDNTITCY